MPTAKQKAANRRNAQHSTGPRTPAGKAKTKLNALKHGLAAETVVLPFESATDYDELRQAVLNDLQPQGITQQILVERFVQRHWVAQRLARTEKAWVQVLYDAHLAEGLRGSKKPKKHPDPHTGLAISMLEIRPDDPRDLIHKNFFRYRSQIEQDFQRALRALERNRLLPTPEEQNENPEIGSVPEPVPQNAKTEPRRAVGVAATPKEAAPLASAPPAPPRPIPPGPHP